MNQEADWMPKRVPRERRMHVEDIYALSDFRVRLDEYWITLRDHSQDVRTIFYDRQRLADHSKEIIKFIKENFDEETQTLK